VLLRSMQQAVYTPEAIGHFGLAYESYTDFTSPLRRYPDLLIHRAIKAALNNETYKAKDWNNLGAHCSMTERRADDASRDVTNWLKCFYMQDKIGEVFEGTVAGVTAFGVFVALDGVYVEGLLHVTELGNDYFHYDKARHEMIGERTSVRYRLGDRLTIKVARVDLETTKMDFSLVNKIGENKAKSMPLPANTHAPARAPAKHGFEKPSHKKAHKAGAKPSSSKSGSNKPSSSKKTSKKKR